MDPKFMIFNGFPISPLDLWITLWATCGKRVETLAAPCVGKDCPLSWHLCAVNEINDLAQFGGNTVLRCNTRCLRSAWAAVWG
jgi:hypothetical protein